MTNLSSRIDSETLAALLEHWMKRAWIATGRPDADNDSDPGSAGGFAAYFAGLDLGSHMNEILDFVPTGSAFADGFNFAVKIAAHVLSDPLGDPVSAIVDAGYAMRDDYERRRADHQRFSSRPASTRGGAE